MHADVMAVSHLSYCESSPVPCYNRQAVGGLYVLFFFATRVDGSFRL